MFVQLWHTIAECYVVDSEVASLPIHSILGSAILVVTPQTLLIWFCSSDACYRHACCGLLIKNVSFREDFFLCVANNSVHIITDSSCELKTNLISSLLLLGTGITNDDNGTNCFHA